MAKNMTARELEDEGSLAFPLIADHVVYGGMTLRDWFAGQALAGGCGYADGAVASELAEEAYAIADAMLSSRNKS